MSIPNIDTFEHDISEEIKTKEATMGDIASASGDLGNVPNQSSSVSGLLISLGVFLIVTIIAVSAFLLIRYNQSPATAPTTRAGTQTPTGIRLASISGTIDSAIGSSVGTITKSQYGYTVEVLSYPTVFAYMLKNEQSYSDEIASAVGSPRDTSTTTPPFSFSDVTINNQNMRVGVSASSTVVYAFVNTKTLLISSSTQGILTLRGAILH